MSAASFIAIIGAGPAGLFAAERLAGQGFAVRVFDRMPSPGRKFLMAGRGGLNLTHSEPMERFPARYARGSALITRALSAFPPEELRRWADGLGAETFTGSSGRVFPRAMKASPLLRAWLRRLSSLGVSIEPGRMLTALRAGELRIDGPEGETVLHPAATLLACGGASWPRLGSDGGWTSALPGNVATIPFAPSNAGVVVNWSTHMLRHAGTPLKRIAITCGSALAKGEVVITRTGLEGGAVYALSEPIRTALARQGDAMLLIDLRPDLAAEAIAARLARAKPKESRSTALRRLAGLDAAAIALLREGGELPADAVALAQRIKAVPLRVTGFAGLDRAISSVGGLPTEALDDRMMITALPGVFAAGEMIDWDAPTGGYLLQGCFSTAALAADGIAAWLKEAER